tara:strand:- start:327 stop:788 length:462 start_codon:yes stop_codon:yes gene_type:complete
MPIAINGNGTITGVSVGGLPDGIVDTDMLANNAVTSAKTTLTGNIVFAEAVINGGSGSPSVTRSTGFGSLTDNGTGDFTLALSSAQADANYTVVGAAGFRSPNLDGCVFGVERNGTNGHQRANTTTAVNFTTMNDSLDAIDTTGKIFIACMRG